MEGLLDWPEKIRASSLSLSGEPERAFGGPRHQQQAMEVERGRDGETGYRLPHLKSSPVIMIAVVAFAGIIDGLFRAVRTFSPESHALHRLKKGMWGNLVDGPNGG